MHPASGIALNCVVAEKPNQQATVGASRSFPRPWYCHGFVDGVVGALPSRHTRSTLRHRSARASPHCQPSHLVLSGQTILAIEPYLHLSALAHHAEQSVRLPAAFGDSWIMRSNIFHTAPLRSRAGGGDGDLCCDSWPGAGLHHGVYLSLHLRGRPLPVSREYWPHRTGVRGRRHSGSLLQPAPSPDLWHTGVPHCRTDRVDMAAKRDVC